MARPLSRLYDDYQVCVLRDRVCESHRCWIWLVPVFLQDGNSREPSGRLVLLNEKEGATNVAACVFALRDGKGFATLSYVAHGDHFHVLIARDLSVEEG